MLDSEELALKTRVCLPRISPELGNQQIDAERSVRVLEMALQLVNVILEHLWALTDAANDANSACTQVAVHYRQCISEWERRATYPS